MIAQSGLLVAALLGWLSNVDGAAEQQAVAGGAAAAGPCAAGDWGGITADPADAVHVRATGDDATGDGSEAAPFASLARAVDHTRTLPLDQRRIAVGPGVFEGSVALDDLDDDGLIIEGCSAAESVLSGDAGTPVLDLAINGEIGLAGLGLVEGEDALTIRNGAMATVRSVEVSDTKGHGVVVEDFATLALLENVTVSDVSGGSACGWGARITDAQVMWLGGGVEDTKALGIFADRADLMLDNLLVDDTAKHTDGTLGRGLHAQRGWTVVADSTFSRNFDAGIFLLEPLGGVIGRIVIDATGAGLVGPNGDPTGDGIVVKGLADWRVVYIVDSLVDGADRAGVLLQDVRAKVAGNLGLNTGLYPVYGGHAFSQGIAQILGPDAPGVIDIAATPEPVDEDYVTCVP